MLYLTRKIGETIIIGKDLSLIVLEIKGRTVKLGFESKSDMQIMRKELYDKIKTPFS